MAQDEKFQEWAKKAAEAQKKQIQQLDIPKEVMLLKQQMRGAKDQFNQIKSQLGELNKLRKAQEDQKQDIREIRDQQEEMWKSLDRIYQTLNEFLAKDRPEASQAARDVAESLEKMEEQIGMIWDAVERLEDHLGLSDGGD